MRLALRVALRFCLPSDFNSAADAMARLLHHGELEEDRHTRLGQCDAVGVASVPGILGSLDFLPRGCFGERRQWRARIHDFPFN